MLVHICCSVDSHYFLQELQKAYPQEELVGFFYNPNIHPKAEHDLRLLDVRRSCEMLGIRLHEGKYDDQEWTCQVKGLEDEPEKGERCSVCFDVRLLETAKLAKNLGVRRFTTTLLSSPMKTQQVLFAQGDKIAQDFGLDFVKIDVRSGGGTQKQNELSKKDNLYRQNYCGCKFALKQQREKQNRFPLEFITPLNRQIMPGSIEHRNMIFSKRNQFEEQDQRYLLTQKTQVVWRCLNARLECFAQTLPCHILVSSSSKKNIRLGSLIWECPKDLRQTLKQGKIGFSKRDDSLFLDLKAFNELTGKNYLSLGELLKNPITYEEELALRAKVAGHCSVCPIVVIEDQNSQDLRLNILSLFQEEKVFEIVEL